MKGIISIRSLGMFILLSCTVLVCLCIVVLSLLRFNSFTTDLTERTQSLSDSLADAALTSSNAAESFFASELLFSTSSFASSLLLRHLAHAVNVNRNARQLVYDHNIDLSSKQGLSRAARLIARAVVRGSDSRLIGSFTMSFRDPYTFGDLGLFVYNDLTFVTPDNSSGLKDELQPSLRVDSVWQVPDWSAVGLVAVDLNDALSGLNPVGFVDGFPGSGPTAAAHGKPRLFVGIARQSSWQFVENSDCPFNSNAVRLDTVDGECKSQYSRSRQQPCPAGAPAGAVCMNDLQLDHSEHSVRLTFGNGAASLSVGSRVYDQSVTPRGTGIPSKSTHGKGKGLAARAGGNPYGSCETAGCALPSSGSAASIATSVFDDHLGMVYTDAKITPLIEAAVALSTETTDRFRNGMSDADVARVKAAGLESEKVRILFIDNRDRVLFSSHGYDLATVQGVRTLDDLNDVVAKRICTEIATKAYADLFEEHEGAHTSTAQATRTATCGFPIATRQTMAPVVTTVSVQMGSGTALWRVRASATSLGNVTCADTDPECVSVAWSVVAVADAFVSYPTTSLRERVALTQSAGLAGMNAASDDAVAKTVLFVVIAAVGAALIAAVLGIAFFLFLTAPVRRVAAMAAAVATMKYETICDTAKEQGIDLQQLDGPACVMPGATATSTPAVKNNSSKPWSGGGTRSSKVVPETPDPMNMSASFDTVTSHQRDPLEETLTGTVAYFRANVLPLREISQLQLGFAQLVQTISSLMKYVPIEIALRYAASPDVARLGMEPRETTVLFSDVVAFTVFCEQRSPRDVLHVMSQYFGTMTECVHASGGTVDKFIGDVVMAAWGAATPCSNGPLSAVTCAVNMLGMAQINSARWRRIRCRVGIHDGKAMVGNIGSPQRFNFTLIGDMVNVAARLKGANRSYGTNMLFSESLIKKAGPELERSFLVRPIGMIRLKGRMTGLLCYEVVACKRLLSRYNKIPEGNVLGSDTPPPTTPAVKGAAGDAFVDADKFPSVIKGGDMSSSTAIPTRPELFSAEKFMGGATARDLYTDNERLVHEHHSAAVLSYVKGEFQTAKASLEQLSGVIAELPRDITAPCVSLLATLEHLIENPPFEFDPCTQQVVK